MKVLQINAIYEQYSTGRTTKELHETLLSMGIDSYVAAPASADFIGGERMYAIGSRLDRRFHGLLSRITGKQGYFSRNATRKLLQYIDHVSPDVLHLRNLHSNYICFPILLQGIAKRNIPIVLTLHDCWFFTGKCSYYIEYSCERWRNGCGRCPDRRKGNPSWFFDRSREMLIKKKEMFSSIAKVAVIGVSQWVAEDAKHSILRDLYCIDYIYNWIELERFRPRNDSALRNMLGLSGKMIILGIAMSWGKIKGLDVFINLAKRLSEDYQIVLVGKVPPQMYADSNSIICLGPVLDVDYLTKLYDMSDVFVNPSVQETFGKTTAEAMACGTPIISNNCTAAPELIGENGVCGYMVQDNNLDEYIYYLQEIKRLGKEHYSGACRTRAEVLFSKDKNIRQYLKIYQGLLSRDESGGEK